jgi:hypothetical protein
MKNRWILSIAAGAALSMAVPLELAAQPARAQQAREQAARQQQQAREQAARQQQQAREQAARQQQQAREQAARQQQQAREQAARQGRQEQTREQAARQARQQQQARERAAQQDREQQARREAERRRAQERARIDDRRRDDRRDDRWYDPRGDVRGGSPAFCRSGQGHPVFGRQWCQQKGFGLGGNTWGNIVFRDRDPRRYQSFGRSGLIDILGLATLTRFEEFGGRGSTTGRWLNDARGRTLLLSIGSSAIARLIDYNGDGRVDNVQLLR